MARTKTDKADKTDALLIARSCALHRPQPWAPPAPEMGHLQALVRRLKSLTEMRQMEHNRKDVSPEAVRASVEAVLAVLDEQIAQTRQRIRDHIGTSPTLRGRRDLLTSIPANAVGHIGEATAAALLAEIGDVSQFAGARQVAAFAGLVPRVRQSGQWKGHVRLSKVGSGRLRHALYFPALAALRSNPLLQALRQRLLGAGKSKMLIVGAAMRKLLTLAFGVLKSGQPFDPNYGPSGGPKTRQPAASGA